MTEATQLLLLQFLHWVAAKPRTYSETMDAWRTSCPRLPVWEDAVDARLVRVEQCGGNCNVVLTADGWAAMVAESCAV